MCYYGCKSKFWEKIENLIKNREFVQNLKFFGKNREFDQKSKFWPKI